MAWSDLTDTQMVSFTDAQTSGFTLNSGQSQVTSNQCMTKAEILAKYNVSATSISGYANNQLVPKGAWGFSGIMTVGGENYNYGYSLAANIGAMTNTDLSDICGAGSVLTTLGYNVSSDQLYININNGSTTVRPNGWRSLQIGATTYFRLDFAENSSPGPNWKWSLDTNNNAIGTTIGAKRSVIIT